MRKDLEKEDNINAKIEVLRKSITLFTKNVGERFRSVNKHLAELEDDMRNAQMQNTKYVLITKGPSLQKETKGEDTLQVR